MLETRLHWRRLVWAALALPLLVGVTSFVVAVTPTGRWQEPLHVGEVVVGGLLVLRYSVRPWLRWRAGWLVVTDRRIGWRSGVLRRRARDLPLHRISEVTYDQRLLQRPFGIGTLRVEPLGEGGTLVVSDVPRIRRVHQLLLERSGPEQLR